MTDRSSSMPNLARVRVLKTARQEGRRLADRVRTEMAWAQAITLRIGSAAVRGLFSPRALERDRIFRESVRIPKSRPKPGSHDVAPVAPLRGLPDLAEVSAVDSACAGPGSCVGCDDGLFAAEEVLGKHCGESCRSSRPRCRADVAGHQIVLIDADPLSLHRRYFGRPVAFAIAISCPSGLVRYERREGIEPAVVVAQVQRALRDGHVASLAGVLVRA